MSPAQPADLPDQLLGGGKVRDGMAAVLAATGMQGYIPALDHQIAEQVRGRGRDPVVTPVSGTDEELAVRGGELRTDRVQGHVIMTTPGLRSMLTPWAVVV